MILLIIALFGFLIPNGIFIYWLLTEFHSFSQFYTDKLALGFILDCVLAMILLGYWFAVKPLGKVKWYWFIVLSLIGGLGFSLPFYYWLNKK